MPYSLPSHPSVRYLGEQAKDLLKAQRRGDASACGVLRQLHRFKDQTDEQILSAQIALHEAQFALALEYGFRSWEDLIHHARAAEEAVVFKDPRAKRLQFKGDPARQDSFSLAVTAALNALGMSADHETVYVLSCNPFAPDLRPEEPSRCHWQMQGRERCLDLIAAAFGVAHRPFPDYHDLAEIPPMPRNDAKAEEAWLKEYYAKPATSYLSHALQMGEVVVSAGEWMFGHPAAPWNWCDWGVVVEARQDGTILGASVNGRIDSLITHIRDGWILRADGEPLPREEIHRRVLERAARRIRGEDPPFGPGSRKIVFGLAAMDAWIAAMNEVPFDVERWQGKDRSLEQTHKTALPTFEGAKTAGKILRALADESGGNSAAPLREAAAQYDRIVELLAPCLAESGDESYLTIMGDPARQRHHAATVLQPVKQCLTRAATCLERAAGL